MEIIERREAASGGATRTSPESIEEWFALVPDPEPELGQTPIMIGNSFVSLERALAMYDASDVLGSFRRHGKKPRSEAIHFWATIAERTGKVVHVSIETFDRTQGRLESHRVYTVSGGYATFYTSTLRITIPLAGW
jgi:hypothetical protein